MSFSCIHHQKTSTQVTVIDDTASLWVEMLSRQISWNLVCFECSRYYLEHLKRSSAALVIKLVDNDILVKIMLQCTDGNSFTI